MKKVSVVFAMLITLYSFNVSASILDKDVLNTINEARISPSLFLKKNGTKIAKYSPKYYEFLKKSKPISPVIWDAGLAKISKSTIVDKNLNPIYDGKNKVCGYSSGGNSGRKEDIILRLMCDFFFNIHDEDYKYFGFYYTSVKNQFYFSWGKTCDMKKIIFTFDEKLDFTSVDFDRLNTAKNADYMRREEKTALQEINLIRAYPKVYAKVIAHSLAKESASSSGLSNEDYIAGLELIDELNKIEVLPILYPAKCIFEAAKLHGLDCQNRGFFSHTGSDGSQPHERILKQCPKFTSTGENGAAGPSENPRDHIISLMIDGGINNRGHRYNIQGKEWRVVGVYKFIDPLCVYGWVQNFAK